MARPILTPGPDHPIFIRETGGRVTVRVGGLTLVDTTRALMLQESTYAPVLYFPREDADLSLLEASDTHTYCPYKGEASYFSIPTEAGLLTDAVWSYEHPHDAVPEIAGYLSFYPDQVDIRSS